MSNIYNWEKLPQILNVETVALIFDVKQTTVRQWIYNGVIHSKKIGKRHFFDKEYIKDLFENYNIPTERINENG